MMEAAMEAGGKDLESEWDLETLGRGLDGHRWVRSRMGQMLIVGISQSECKIAHNLAAITFELTPSQGGGGVM